VMLSQKVVTPVKTGVQPFHNFLKTLDSCFRRNDEMPLFFLFCECIKMSSLINIYKAPPSVGQGIIL